MSFINPGHVSSLIAFGAALFVLLPVPMQQLSL